MILHRFEYGVYRFLAKVLSLLIERICLIDEEYSSHCLLDLLLSLYGSLAYISRNKSGPVCFNELTC